MAPPVRRITAWGPVAGALLLGASGAGVAAWQVGLRAIAGQIEQKRADLKKLAVTGRIPPNKEVSEYLKARQEHVDARYRHWLERVAAPPMTAAAAADPQLFFQEQVHGLQGTLERLATARKAKPPELLGVPKDLPPSDTVPRLLTQLDLLQSSAELVYARGISEIMSLKLEDPELVPAPEGDTVFLTRVPVRVRMSVTLPQLMDVLSALERQRPMIDVASARLARQETSGQLEADLLLSRYLVAPETAVPVKPDTAAARQKSERALAKPADAKP